MINKTKRFLSAVLSAAVVMTTAVVPAFAIEPVTGTIGFDGLTLSTHDGSLSSVAEATTATSEQMFDSENFGGYTKVAVANSSTSHGAMTIEKGNFGKPESDQVLHMWRPEGFTCADGGGGQNFTIGHQAVAMDEGQYTEIEVYMAWDGTSADKKGIVGYYTPPAEVGNNNNGKTNYGGGLEYLLFVDGTGKLTVLGADAGVTMAANKWYKINLVMKSGKGGISDTEISGKTGTKDNWGKYPVTDAAMNTNTYSLYIDNVPAIQNKPFTPFGNIYSQAQSSAAFGGYKWATAGYFDKFVGLYQIQVELRTPAANTKTSGVWFDDISYSNGLNEAPVYLTDVTFSLKDTASDVAKLYQGVTSGATQYVDERVNPNDFICGGNDVVTEKTSLKNGESINIWTTTSDGEKLGASITNSHTVNKAVDCSGKSDIGIGSRPGTMTMAYAQTAPLGGVSGNGYATAKTKANTVWSAQEDGYQEDWFTTGVLPFTTEYTYLLDGEFDRLDVSIQGETWWTINLRGDGTITVNNNAGWVIGRYNKGQWVRMAITYYLTQKQAEVYMNGELLGTFTTNCSKVSRTKRTFRTAADADGNIADAIWAIDDFHQYFGSKPDSSDEPKAVITGDSVTVGKGVMFVPTLKQAQSSFYADLTATGCDLDNAKIYTDATFATENTGNIKNGNILVVPRNLDANGKGYSYYYLATGNPATVAITKVSEELSAGTHTGVKVNANYFKPINTCAQMLIAQYEGDILKKVDRVELTAASIAGHSGENYEYPYAVTSKAFDIEILEGTDVKAYIFDSMSRIVPLSNPRFLN